jgi:hypothetical protein
VAEQEGFEPSVQQKLYAGFRIRCIRPLCHRSAGIKDVIITDEFRSWHVELGVTESLTLQGCMMNKSEWMCEADEGMDKNLR